MIMENVIELAKTEWTALIAISGREDGLIRFRTNYWSMSSVTIRDCYCNLRMDECIDSLGEKTVRSTLKRNL